MRQTLMGLGSVKVLNEGEASPAPASAPQGNLRSTMAGMPGISIKKPTDRPKTTPANQVLSRGTMMGMPAISGKLNEPAIQAPMDSQATVTISDDHVQRAKLLAQSIAKAERAAAPQPKAPPAPAPVAAKPAHQPIPIPEPEEEEFDPLAGMIGVQEPKVSSLMDEEVENLSAQVFGAEFSFDEEEFDDEDEDDFDDFTFGGGGGGSSAQASKPTSAAKAPPPEEDEDDVHHDIAAAEAALANMMMDLEDVMPTEDEAAAALGLDEAKVAAAHAAAQDEEEDEPFEPETNDDDSPTIADADVASIMAQVKPAAKAPQPVADELPPPRKAEPAIQDEPEPAPAPKPKQKKAKRASAALGVGFGPGGIVAAIGALATIAWMLIPNADGAMAISGFLALDVGSKVLGVFSFVAAVLAVVTSLMRLPAFSKMLILVVLGLGLGVLSTSAKVMSQSPANFVVYAAAGLFVIAAIVYKLTAPKK